MENQSIEKDFATNPTKQSLCQPFISNVNDIIMTQSLINEKGGDRFVRH